MNTFVNSALNLIRSCLIGSVLCVIVLPLGLLTFQLFAGDETLPLPDPLPKVKHPDNANAAAKFVLGRKLFFDPQLSSTGKVSCATCHDPAKGFSNGERVATGVDGRKGSRNVPTLYIVAYNRFQFWDGRATTLEEQALMPIQHPKEMNMPLDTLVERLNKDAQYQMQFQDAFGGKITASRIAQAIAAFERTIISMDTPFDRYLKGDKQALSASSLRGMQLFYGQARCFLCHKGPNFTDNDFHNVGILDPKLPDVGRSTVTGRKSDEGRFKTPTLREVASTAPYMHNGSFKTLKEVVWHYNFGGVTEQENENRDELLEVLYLSDEQVDDLVAFLRDGLKSTNPPKGSQR